MKIIYRSIDYTQALPKN